MGKLDGRTALITGSSSGIGAGVAAAFAREGADVVINFPTERQEEEANGVRARVEKEGRRCLAVMADITDEAETRTLYDRANEFLGRVDILVNNAGISESAPIDRLSTASWDRMIAIHLRGLFLMTRLCLPGMYERDYGKIINTASQLAYIGAPGYAHYVTAKAGILGFTRSLALEIGNRNLNANCVGPGATRTPLLDNLPAELLDQIRAAIPKGRFAEVHEIVPTYVFLASEDAAFFQGQCLSPNGGDAFL